VLKLEAIGCFHSNSMVLARVLILFTFTRALLLEIEAPVRLFFHSCYTKTSQSTIVEIFIEQHAISILGQTNLFDSKAENEKTRLPGCQFKKNQVRGQR
jgi:hypothetical protein